MRGINRMAALVAAGVIAAPAMGQNLLGNGSFEDMGPGLIEFDVWGVFNNAFADGPLDVSNEVTAQDGVRSMKCFGFFNGAEQNDHGAFQEIAVTENTEYTLSGYGLTLASDPIEVFDPADPDGNGFWGNLPLVIIDFKDSGGTTIAGASAEINLYPTANPDVWNFAETTATAPAGAVSAQVTVLFIQFVDSPGSFFFDNISLVEGDPVSTACNPADLNADGVLNLDDIDAFVAAFLAGCP
ncbi:MAG: hypothetical protein RIB60_11350 [Phycisphaerales bacterium]